MRLWHKDLIPVLPDNQLRGQWRECCLIAKALHDGNLNHLLVNKVKEYPIEDFCEYCNLVLAQMVLRGFNITERSIGLLEQNISFAVDVKAQTGKGIFDGWHNDRYLRQCLYNLQEKADSNGIPSEQWARIVKKYPWIE